MKLNFYYYFINYFIILIIFLSIIFGFYIIKEWIYNYCRNPLSYVIVTGNCNFTTNDDIKNLLMQLEVLGTFITQDVDIIQKKIKKLSWIKQVSVRKKWPDTLKIHLVEYIPIAYWNDQLMISTTGTVFTIPNLECINIQNVCNMACMPFLYGPSDKVQDVLNNYLIFQMILRSNQIQIKSIKVDVYCAWQLELMGNMYLKLGRENIIERLCYFIRIYPILVQKMYKKNKSIDYIDLRYRKGFVVKWMNHLSTPISLYNR